MASSRIYYNSPLLSLDIYLDAFHQKIKQLKSTSDISTISSITREPVSDEIKALIEQEQYDSLIVTNLNQEIMWVSEGFYEMTGFSRKHALGKRPNFLQGPQTSKETTKEISNKIKSDLPFNGAILNYKKNGEEYLCQIKIVPIRNKSQKVTHYLALERKLEAA